MKISKIKNFVKNNKFVVAASSLALASTNSFAAVAFDKTAGFSGEFDLTFFYSAAGIVVVATCAILAVKKGIQLFK